ncbi:Predicted arabinose efflux permease, MFS family [Tessaracoccus bendigoensis DSM 12906]|uniref:Predicted arabinose efflux permease, MFS family n=1 Tax=Tessaracoccus bendigoensis DSM 12906 TaxID=1123357 RepID=A0A1M6IYI4_9ACTN|nr:MFS transporter [Tessaracoccus bendigoensis]SHJ39485.1 Predicted arabinose efflux permease, MFS family [Tessaracoccus bendigoensis DSM 12906]
MTRNNKAQPPHEPTPPTDRRPVADEGFAKLIRLVGWPYVVASALARLPQSMLTIGALTYVAAGASDFTTPGAVAAIAGVGVGIGAPIMGTASDRWGQRIVLLLSTVAYVAALGGLLWAGSPRDGLVQLDPTLIGSALLAGMVVPQVGPMARVRWIRRLTGPNDRATIDLALGYESTVDELSYVFGPALVGIVASAAGAPVPLVIAGVLAMIAVPAFVADRSSGAGAAVAHQAGAGVSGPVRTAWGFMAIAVAGMLGVGAVFGSLATTMTVFADESGHPGTGGLLYAAMGITSGLGALSVSRWPARWSAAARWLLCAVIAVPATGLLLLPNDPWQMALGLLLVGAPIGPILVTIFAAAGQRTPPARLGFAMTLLSASITLGTSAGNLLGGTVADASGHRAALGVTIGAAVLLLACGAIFARYAKWERLRASA